MNQEKSKSFLTSLSQEDKFLYKIIGKDNHLNQKSWWIIRVFPQKLAVFEGLINKGNLNLADYGEILESDFGEVPSNILTKYGFDI